LHTQETVGDPLPARRIVGNVADLCKQLRDAALDGRVDKLRRLVELGADVSAPDQYGGTALHEAAVTGHVEAMRVLVELGADVHACCINAHMYTYII
jgi:ankyrin repeat protein